MLGLMMKIKTLVKKALKNAWLLDDELEKEDMKNEEKNNED